ncbi:histone deacetylase and transcriptional regulator [Batrachochytrium dendrobatidis]|nr:histone deacetylase and transcriptional regulator [Batrachochytrium dendrobatidis]
MQHRTSSSSTSGTTPNNGYRNDGFVSRDHPTPSASTIGGNGQPQPPTLPPLSSFRHVPPPHGSSNAYSHPSTTTLPPPTSISAHSREYHYYSQQQPGHVSSHSTNSAIATTSHAINPSAANARQGSSVGSATSGANHASIGSTTGSTTVGSTAITTRPTHIQQQGYSDYDREYYSQHHPQSEYGNSTAIASHGNGNHHPSQHYYRQYNSGTGSGGSHYNPPPPQHMLHGSGHQQIHHHSPTHPQIHSQSTGSGAQSGMTYGRDPHPYSIQHHQQQHYNQQQPMDMHHTVISPLPGPAQYHHQHHSIVPTSQQHRDQRDHQQQSMPYHHPMQQHPHLNQHHQQQSMHHPQEYQRHSYQPVHHSQPPRIEHRKSFSGSLPVSHQPSQYQQHQNNFRGDNLDESHDSTAAAAYRPLSHPSTAGSASHADNDITTITPIVPTTSVMPAASNAAPSNTNAKLAPVTTSPTMSGQALHGSTYPLQQIQQSERQQIKQEYSSVNDSESTFYPAKESNPLQPIQSLQQKKSVVRPKSPPQGNGPIARRPIGRPRSSATTKFDAPNPPPQSRPHQTARNTSPGTYTDHSNASESSDGYKESYADMAYANHQLGTSLSAATHRKPRIFHDVDEHLEKLDITFQAQKDEIYRSRLDKFAKETKELRMGIYPEYLDALKVLEQERDAALVEAALFRDYTIECAKKVHQLEHDTCLTEYVGEKSGLRESMLNQLNEKKRKLKEERDGFDVATDAGIEATKNVGIRKAARLNQRFNAGNNGSEEGAMSRKNGKRNKGQNGPLLVFQLKDHEIYDDLGLLRRNANVRKATSGYKSRR